MSILVMMSGSENQLDKIKHDFADQGFDEPIYIPGDDFSPADIEMILAWKPGQQDWSAYPNVKLVQSWGAGVDHLLDAHLPDEWTVARYMSQSLKDRMARFVTAMLSNWQLDMPTLFDAQSRGEWAWHEGRWGERVLILGMGELGRSVAESLVPQGYKVDGWSRSGKELEGVRSLTGEAGLAQGLEECDYLINLLPLTSATRGLMNRDFWARCGRQPVVMNVGRGASLVEDDLIPALVGGQIRGAILDVFETEPLPHGHPFWTHPDIWVTPHIASISEPKDVVALAIENLKRVRGAQAPRFEVDLSQEY
ncbi:2-hydroxyacid dehydrogenase [Saccharospirillum salsuginis]|uniref:Glyoxylate/hydroxypyruvate reductase A n=1 Tax=Saccharospirillum salsuginis TaxID=418750 RepID=A0A918KBS0_9GAMM|nr:glyoxylate/hydroxypyruvate reductase A [Saccharospirillum salsuginis]GGX55718.1 glyoxylate/hydroxypyruvate reductase A [Saccharospirillum salsuginis]